VAIAAALPATLVAMVSATGLIYLAIAFPAPCPAVPVGGCARDAAVLSTIRRYA